MITDTHLDELRALFVRHGVVLAYLFGSHAEGTARPASDVDVAVLLPPGTPRDKFFDVRLNLTNDLMEVLHKNEVDVVVLNEAPPLLAHQVIKYGKVLYEEVATSPAVDFAAYTLSRYADTKCFRQISLRYLTESVEQYRLQRAALILREKDQ
jgi:hypothetical protein